MKKPHALAAALTAALAAGAVAPALANGAGSTTTIIVLSAAAVGSVPLIVNYNHKVREKRAEEQEVSAPARRLSRLVLPQVRLLPDLRTVQAVVRADVQHESVGTEDVNERRATPRNGLGVLLY